MIPESFRIELREYFTNTIIVAGSYTQARADEVLKKGYADLVARLKHQQPLAELDGATLFGGNERGYTDYTALHV